MVFVKRHGEISLSPKVLSDLSVGSTVYLKENGVETEYILVNQGIPSNSVDYDYSCNGAWILRKNIYSSGRWNNDGDINDYGNSTISDKTLNNFLSVLSQSVQSLIKTVKIPYIKGGSPNLGGTISTGENGLPCKAFLLSQSEVGGTLEDDPYSVEVGAKLSFFDFGLSTEAKEKRIALTNGGSASDWWLRTVPRSSMYGSDVEAISSTGTFVGIVMRTYTVGIRPAMVFPFDTPITENGLIG